MVHSEPSKGRPAKIRGRPFLPGNVRGKPKPGILADTRHKGGTGREDMSINAAEEEDDDNDLHETIENPTQALPSEAQEEEPIIDQIEFTHGKNTLKIIMRKKHNRLFKTQVILNDKTEIRPVTYTGSTMAQAFWGLLKRSLLKE